MPSVSGKGELISEWVQGASTKSLAISAHRRGLAAYQIWRERGELLPLSVLRPVHLPFAYWSSAEERPRTPVKG